MDKSNENLLYFLDNKPYINMTNACTNACVFCLRNQKDDVQGANLWLDKDSITTSAVISQIEAKKDIIAKSDEIVFCGYGEPECALNVGVSGPGVVKAAIEHLGKDADMGELAKCRRT